MTLTTIAHKSLPASWDVAHYLGTLVTFPENEWFTPTNKDGEAYTICEELAQAGIICSKSEPLWNNGSFMGMRKSYLYNKDCKY